MAKSLQSNIKAYEKDMTKHSLFIGGLNVKNSAIEQYDPLKTGYARIFFVRMPRFMEALMPDQTKNFKHLLEYGNVSIDGIQGITLDFEQMGGGYANRSFDVATVAKDDTNSLTIKVFELSGSPVREYTDMWISGISDPYTGIGHYHGKISKQLPYCAANHTAEAFYVNTDPTGTEDGVEYVCMLANMMPKGVKKDHYNYASGEHQLVQTDIEFTAVKYESPQINEIGKALLAKYKVLRNYLDFQSGYTQEYIDKNLEDSNISDWNI